MTTCDAKYTFTSVSVGSYGSQNDGGILRNSPFGMQLMNGTLPLPSDAPLWNGSLENFPHYFVGDAAFPLRTNLMRPYPGATTALPQIQDVFNYRLSRARRTIENNFGILTARWRSVIECNPENAGKIVLACLVLHNFIMLNDTRRWYCPERYADWENPENEVQRGIWKSELADIGGALPSIRSSFRNASSAAFDLRGKLANFFMDEGEISFQYTRRN